MLGRPQAGPKDSGIEPDLILQPSVLNVSGIPAGKTTVVVFPVKSPRSQGRRASDPHRSERAIFVFETSCRAPAASALPQKLSGTSTRTADKRDAPRFCNSPWLPGNARAASLGAGANQCDIPLKMGWSSNPGVRQTPADVLLSRFISIRRQTCPWSIPLPGRWTTG